MDRYTNLMSSQLPIERRKWLDLARIIVNRPKFIMMDEVLAGLNPSEIEHSLKLVRRINTEFNITILFIEHVMKAVVSLCDRAIVLNEGRVIADGLPAEVLALEEVVKAYIGADEEDE